MKKYKGLFSHVRWLVIAILFGSLMIGLSTNQVHAKTSSLETAFQQAANKYQVPVNLLKAVSYNESSFESHGGQPSVAGGYGVMHLTDTTGLIPNGANSKAEKVPNAASLHTLQKAAKLTGISVSKLKSNTTANIQGGAALLAAYQKSLGKPLTTNSASWYSAVKKYSQSDSKPAAEFFLPPMCIRFWLREFIKTGSPLPLRR
nr:hypothetical protein [Lentilactobacillus otakiensis]